MKTQYTWDGKPVPVTDEEAEKQRRIQAYLDSEITVDYLKTHQDSEEQIEVMSDIFGYMEDLMWADRFDIIDEYILEFCNCNTPAIRFQYYVCLLTCAMWAKKELKNRQFLIKKAIEVGIKERQNEKEVMQVLQGLIND